MTTTDPRKTAAPLPPASDGPGGGDDPHAHEPIGSVRELYDGALAPDLVVSTLRNGARLFASRAIARGAAVRALPRAEQELGALAFTSRGRRWDLVDYLAVNRVTGLLVLKDGRIALELYQCGNTPRTRWASMSIAKSITSTLIAAAVQQGAIGSIADPVTRYLPALADSAYAGVSIRDVLMMASGARWDETYTDPASDRRRQLEAQIAQRPGAALALMARLPRAAAPGTVHNYSTGETLVAGELVRAATGMPLAAYLSDRIWAKFGMEAEASWWLDSPGGAETGGTGVSATLRDYGRFGLFFLGGGIAGGERILPAGWTDAAGTPKTLRGGGRLDYGYLWWPALATAATPDPGGAFLARGIFGQHLYLSPRERVVIVVWSARSKPQGMDLIDDLDFCAAAAAALRAGRAGG